MSAVLMQGSKHISVLIYHQFRCTDKLNEITLEICSKTNDVMLSIRGIAIDANGEMGTVGGKEFLFLFSPSKKGWGKELAQIRKGRRESKCPLKEEK